MSTLPTQKRIPQRLLRCACLLVIFAGLLLFGQKGSVLSVGPDPYLSYQGRLADQNGNLLTGNYYIVFCIYTTSSPGTNCTPETTPAQGAIGTLTGSALNSALWGESQYFSATNSPDNHVVNGVFNAKLGSQSSFPATLFNANSQLWLGVNVYNGSSWDGQMSPLQEIVSAGFAINAGQVGGFSASQTPGANNVVVLDGSGNININTGTKNIFGATVSGTANNGLVNIGSGGFGGGGGNFVGSSSGTQLAVNAASGFTGNINDFQLNGSSLYSLDYQGNIISNDGNHTLNTLSNASTAPTLSVTNSGGSLAAGTWYGKYTWYNSDGETLASSESTQATTSGGSSKIQFTIPTIPTGATGARLYLTNVNGASGTEVYQNVTITSGTTGTVTAYNAGASTPTVNTAGGTIRANGAESIFSSAANPTANYGVVDIGPGGFAGGGGTNFAGSSSGTLLALNAASSYGGNLLDLQTAGTSELKISASGNLTALGDVNIGSGVSGVASNSIYADTYLKNGNLYLDAAHNPTSAPTLGSVAGGAIGATTYYAEYTWSNNDGQTTVSPEASLAVSANHLLTLTVPTFPVGTGITAFCAYVATSSGAETRQGFCISISAGTWTESTSGLSAGPLAPSYNQAGDGINFDNFCSYIYAEDPNYNLDFDTTGCNGNFLFKDTGGTITLAPSSSGGSNLNLLESQGASGAGTNDLTITGVNGSTAITNLTFNATSSIFNGNDNIFNSAANAGANYGVVNIGNGGFSGGANNFSGGTNGTLLAINSASNVGNLIDFQAKGNSYLSLSSATADLFLNDGDFTVNNIADPSTAPTLSTGAGGSLTADTYFAEFNWNDANGSSLVSPESSGLSVSTNGTLTITLPAGTNGVFPGPVTSAQVYVREGAGGTERLQGSISSSNGSLQITSYNGSGAIVSQTASISGGAKFFGRVNITQPGGTTPNGLVLNNTGSSALTAPNIVFQVNSGSNRYITADATPNIIFKNSSFSSVDTFGDDGSITSSGSDNIFSGSINAGANYAVFNVGTGGFAGAANGFSGSASGTELAVNASSGFAGNLVDFQTAGTSAFKIAGSTGDITTASTLVAPSSAPVVSAISGGSLSVGNYLAKYTWYDAEGETTASPESTTVTTTSTNKTIQFSIASIPAAATGAKLYLTAVGGATNTEVFQNVTITSGTTGTVTVNNSGVTAYTYPAANTAGGGLSLAGALTHVGGSATVGAVGAAITVAEGNTNASVQNNVYTTLSYTTPTTGFYRVGCWWRQVNAAADLIQIVYTDAATNSSRASIIGAVGNGTVTAMNGSNTSPNPINTCIDSEVYALANTAISVQFKDPGATPSDQFYATLERVY